MPYSATELLDQAVETANAAREVLAAPSEPAITGRGMALATLAGAYSATAQAVLTGELIAVIAAAMGED